MILLLLGVGLVQSTLVAQNVVFQKVNEVTTTRARWLVTFVTDLNPYIDGMAQLARDVSAATGTAWQVIGHYTRKGHKYDCSL